MEAGKGHELPANPGGGFFLLQFLHSCLDSRKEKILKANDKKQEAIGTNNNKNDIHIIEHLLWAWLFTGIISFDPHLTL